VADLKAAGAQAGNEAVDLLAGADGFAEVYPEDKYIVVQHLQAAGHVTGMTGDGVNWFWATLPSKTFLSALTADALLGTVLTFVGLPDLMPLPWWQTLAVFVYALVACLGVNDALKVAMIKWRVVNAVAEKPVDETPHIHKRAYELDEQQGRREDRAV